MDFAAASLGLQYGTVRLVESDPNWASVGHSLAAETQQLLGDSVEAVEHVGSTAVPGLVAKPVIDLALGVALGVDRDEFVGLMAGAGWVYRGDAGDDGGWVFVLEDSPWRRVAHAHGVRFGDERWRRYLRFRDLLRRDEAARCAYAETKRHLAELHPDDMNAYISGKSETVEGLLIAGG